MGDVFLSPFIFPAVALFFQDNQNESNRNKNRAECV